MMSLNQNCSKRICNPNQDQHRSWVGYIGQLCSMQLWFLPLAELQGKRRRSRTKQEWINQDHAAFVFGFRLNLFRTSRYNILYIDVFLSYSFPLRRCQVRNLVAPSVVSPKELAKELGTQSTMQSLDENICQLVKFKNCINLERVSHRGFGSKWFKWWPDNVIAFHFCHTK